MNLFMLFLFSLTCLSRLLTNVCNYALRVAMGLIGVAFMGSSSGKE
jgi:hypothetical protein